MIYDNLKKQDVVKNNYNKLINLVKEEIEVQNIYEKYFSVEEGDIIVDIGANIGIFSKKFKDKASKIYALEPDPLFLNELQKIKGIAAIPVGISYKDGESLIKSDGHANSIGKGDISIRTIKFTTFLQKYKIKKIDFLKMDCEGAEYDIFTEENVEWLSKNCKNIAGEFHLHNDESRIKLILTLLYFEKYGLPYKITSVDGFEITKDSLLKNINFYSEVLFYVSKSINNSPDITVSFYKRPSITMRGGYGIYTVLFKNNATGEVLYSAKLDASDSSASTYYEYYIPWKIEVYNPSGKLEKEFVNNLEGKKVLINITSTSLGDTLAWIPYVEEFRKTHNCEMYCSTSLNHLFTETYEKINFVQPGVPVETSCYYEIGWFYDKEFNKFKHPLDPRPQRMQKTASDILGLEYKEIKPKIVLPDVTEKNTITLGYHATSQAKYWNNPTGWQETVNYINSVGYTPVLLSREPSGFNGNKNPEGVLIPQSFDLQDIIKKICESKLFIGIGSGLSWLAWACDVPVILVSGFSNDETEMKDCIRISAPENTCNGCFNKYIFDRTDWNWCPVNKGTNKEFECTKKITSKVIIDKINQILNIK